jgi:hypothetical protein
VVPEICGTLREKRQERLHFIAIYGKIHIISRMKAAMDE